MNQHQPNDEILEQAALYALGALQGKEKEEFEQQVTEGCATCQAVKDFQQVADMLGTSAEPVTPPNALRGKLLDRVRAEPHRPVEKQSASQAKTESESLGLTFVYANDDLWQEIQPGLSLKMLSVDQKAGRATALARMAAGCNYAPHRHTKAEELYVLEGTCYCAGVLLHPGDYHRAEAGSIHYETSTQDGCLMFVVFAPDNEMLEPTQA